jgi:hypothetical protein
MSLHGTMRLEEVFYYSKHGCEPRVTLLEFPVACTDPSLARTLRLHDKKLTNSSSNC